MISISISGHGRYYCVWGSVETKQQCAAWLVHREPLRLAAIFITHGVDVVNFMFYVPGSGGFARVHTIKY